MAILRGSWEVAAAYYTCYPLPRSGLAWEFTRRHPDYQADYDAANGSPTTDLAAKWGLMLMENPAIHARDALVFWRADAQPGMLQTTPRTTRTDVGAIDLWTEPGRKAIALTQGGLVVLIERDHGQYRLLFEDSESIGDRVAFDIRIGSPPENLAEVETARAFIGTFIADRERRQAMDPLAPKLARYLQALDARLAGASYERIGQALFAGDALLATQAGRLVLKSRTRHAVRRGFALMNGGYRQLLLPSRT